MDEATWRAGSERLAPFLSKRGRAARMPEGIRVWGERAARAGALDATMGVITAPAGALGDGPRGGGGDGAAPAESIAYLPAIRAAFGAWEAEEVFPYAPVAGMPAFREAWRRWIEIKSAGGDPDADGRLAGRLTLPVATPGVTGALAAVGLLLTDPGDTVLVPDRRWDGYDTTFGTVLGARLAPVRLLRGGEWDLEAWEAAMAHAARKGRVVSVVNFPHNPTGYVPTEADEERFAAIVVGTAERTGAAIAVLCDDAYEGYVYTERPRWSIFYRLIDRHPRFLPVKCDGITKELLFWGGRLGALTTAFPAAWGEEACAMAEKVWENKLASVVRGMVSSASTPIQALAARVLAEPAQLLEARRPIFESLVSRRSMFADALEAERARAAFDPDPFHGGLFALLNLRKGAAIPAAESLLARGVGVVPFSDPAIGLNALRITYATVPAGRIDDLVSRAVEAVA